MWQAILISNKHWLDRTTLFHFNKINKKHMLKCVIEKLITETILHKGTKIKFSKLNLFDK